MALALVLEGHSREEATQLHGMERQTLQDWVHRYNQDGVAGLSSRHSPGRPPALSEDRMEALRQMVLDGADLNRDGVVRWGVPICARRLRRAGRSCCTTIRSDVCYAGSR